MVYIFFYLLALVYIPNAFGQLTMNGSHHKGDEVVPNVYEIASGELAPILDGFKQHYLFVLITTREDKYQCAMCEQLDPIYLQYVDDILEYFPELENEVAFMRVEAGDHLELLKSLGIKAIPSLWAFPTSLDVYGRLLLGELELLVDEHKSGKLNEDDLALKLNELDPSLEYSQLGKEHYVFELAQGESMNEMLLRLAGFISKTLKMNVLPALKSKAATGQSKFSYTLICECLIGLLVLYKVISSIRENQVAGTTPFWQEKKLYVYLSVVLIFINISGFNFCLQRHSPLIAQSKGDIVWIAPGNRQQMGFEIMLSIGFQCIFFLLLISLIDGVKLFNETDGSKDFVILLLSLILLVFLGFFTSTYGLKDSNYPFTLQKYFNF